MDDVIVRYFFEPEVKNGILIEGLPGVGNVGKLAAEHMIDVLGARKFASLYSRYLPPQVLISDDGTVRLVSQDLHVYRGEDADIVFLTGDYQGMSQEGQYELSMATLDIVEKLGVKKIFTLGGYGSGKMEDEPRVLGAVTDEKMIPELKDAGVEFSAGEPSSGIVGASGLLLGLGELRGMKGACLMGETSGYFVDPRGASALIAILSKVLGIEVDTSSLQKKVVEMEELAKHLKEMEEEGAGDKQDLSYIG